ncbi:16981_t:CDS:2, partial [Rhizophagus irregularis]
MEAYGKRYGFMIIKKRLAQFDINRHRDCKSKRQQCPWNANFNCPQNFQV